MSTKAYFFLPYQTRLDVLIFIKKFVVSETYATKYEKMEIAISVIK